MGHNNNPKPPKIVSKWRNKGLWTTLVKALILSAFKFCRKILTWARKFTNILQLKNLCMEKWSKFSILMSEWWAVIQNAYEKSFLLKGGATPSFVKRVLTFL